MKAISVKAIGDYKIEVVFYGGVSGIIDLETLVKKGIFQQLQDKKMFQKVYTDGSAIAWSDELEIDAGYIFAEILNADPSTLLHTPSFHAAD